MRSGLTAAIAIAVLAICALSGHTGPLAKEEVAPERSRLGMNIAGLADWNTELPFVDVFRLSRTWISQREGEAWGNGPRRLGRVRRVGSEHAAGTAAPQRRDWLEF